MKTGTVRKVKTPNHSLIFEQKVIEQVKKAEQLIKRSQESVRLTQELVEQLRRNRARARRLTKSR